MSPHCSYWARLRAQSASPGLPEPHGERAWRGIARAVVALDVALERHDAHHLVAQPLAAELDALDVEAAGAAREGADGGVQLELGGAPLVLGGPDQHVAAGHVDVELLAAEADQVRVVCRVFLVRGRRCRIPRFVSCRGGGR